MSECQYRTVYLFDGGEMTGYYDDDYTQEVVALRTLGRETAQGRVIHTARLFDVDGNLTGELEH